MPPNRTRGFDLPKPLSLDRFVALIMPRRDTHPHFVLLTGCVWIYFTLRHLSIIAVLTGLDQGRSSESLCKWSIMCNILHL